MYYILFLNSQPFENKVKTKIKTTALKGVLKQIPWKIVKSNFMLSTPRKLSDLFRL